MTHYHVSRHSEDDDVFVTDDLFAALDYAATELASLADFEHDGISASGEMGDYESAYNAFVKCARYTNVQANCANMVKQHNAKDADRAPLYQVDSAGVRLFEAAKHVMEMVNDDSPLGVWGCEAELHTWPAEDMLHGGESYCSDEYPDGYAGY